ncbi:MAG: hypothetical protein V9G20_31295 [Candidatus Promineifilaceae bacterium]
MNEQPATNPEPKPSRKRWPLKTMLEVFPIFMALSALLTFGTTKKVSDVQLLTPLKQVVGVLPLWATVLMVAAMLVGILGIIWATYIFSRAPVAPDGSDDQ